MRLISFIKPSVPILIFSNLIPLYGALFWGWTSEIALLLYWSENLIVGFFNILKMTFNQTSKGPFKYINNGRPAQMSSPKQFYIPFFCIHYGIFTFGHGIFVFALSFMSSASFNLDSALRTISLPFIVSFISHGLSFLFNYLGNEEFKTLSLDNLMVQPYKRIVIVHLSIFAAIGFKSTAIALVVVKTIIDLASHLFEHSNKNPRPSSATI